MTYFVIERVTYNQVEPQMAYSVAVFDGVS